MTNGVLYSDNFGTGDYRKSSSSSSSFPYSPSPFPLPRPSLPSFPCLPLKVGQLNPVRGSGERCKLPKRGLERSLSLNRMWCILALKYDIWWQKFQWFSWESTYEVIAAVSPFPLVLVSFGERRFPKNIWGNGVPPRSPSTTWQWPTAGMTSLHSEP